MGLAEDLKSKQTNQPKKKKKKKKKMRFPGKEEILPQDSLRAILPELPLAGLPSGFWFLVHIHHMNQFLK